MKGKLLALCLSGLLLAALPTAWAGQNQPLIDCDAGGDLATGLPRAVAAGFSTIYLRGTCTGNFVIDTPGLQLRGDPNATIQGIDSGGFPPAIRVVGPIDLVLRNLEIRNGYFGVQVENSGAFGVYSFFNHAQFTWSERKHPCDAAHLFCFSTHPCLRNFYCDLSKP